MSVCYLICAGQSVGHGSDYIESRNGRTITIKNRATGKSFDCEVSQQWGGEVAYLGFNSLMIDAGPHGLNYLCP